MTATRHPSRLYRLGLPLLAGLLLAAPARAEVVQFDIVATVDGVYDPGNLLGGTIDPDFDLITGHYSFDSAVADSNPDPKIGVYVQGPSLGFAVNVGPFEFVTDPANTDFLLEIQNDLFSSLGLIDGYTVEGHNHLPTGDGLTASLISWQLADPTGTALQSDALSADPPSILDFDVTTSSFTINGCRAVDLGPTGCSGIGFGIVGEVVLVTAAEPDVVVVLDALIGKIHELPVRPTRWLLRAPLRRAVTLLNDDDPSNDDRACRKVNVFLRIVDVLERLEWLNSATADDFRADAGTILGLLGCSAS